MEQDTPQPDMDRVVDYGPTEERQAIETLLGVGATTAEIIRRIVDQDEAIEARRAGKLVIDFGRKGVHVPPVQHPPRPQDFHEEAFTGEEFPVMDAWIPTTTFPGTWPQTYAALKALRATAKAENAAITDGHAFEVPALPYVMLLKRFAQALRVCEDVEDVPIKQRMDVLDALLSGDLAP